MTHITIEKEKLEKVLEALYGFIPYLPLSDDDQCEKYDKAITAIEQALAAPAQPAPIPDAITDNSESPDYKAGFNECRELTIQMRKS
jgi:hypothetical protein